MPMKFITGTVVACGLAAVALPAAAHHAMVMYDRSRTVTLTGTVVELRWTNPHVFLVVHGSVGADDPPADWLLETSGPGNLIRWGGWSPTALQPGDRVSVDINPLREGDRKNARLTKVTNVDTGQVLGTGYLDLDLARPR